MAIGRNSCLTWVGAALVILGRGFLVYGEYRYGFAISCIGDTCWIVWGATNREYALVILDAVLLAVDVVGVWLAV